MPSNPTCTIVRLVSPESTLMESLDRFHQDLVGADAPPDQFTCFVHQRLGDERMLLILALIGETPVGYAMAFDVAEHPFMPEWRRAGYITQFYVAPAHRRHGVGKLMCDYVVGWLASRGIASVQLNVELDNPEGNAFWQSQGFVPLRLRMKRPIQGATDTDS